MATWEVRYDKSKDVWKVQKAGALRALKNFDKKSRAASYGRKKARKNKPSRLNILDRSGNIVSQPTYG